MKSVKFACVFSLLCFVIGPIFAQSNNQLNDGFWRYYTPAERTKSLTDKSNAVDQGEGGVMFMATATPEDPSLLSDPKKPISLSYNKGAKDGARLSVKIGGKKITIKGLYDWVLLSAVNYADSAYTNGTTLQGEADNENEDEAKRADYYRSKAGGIDVCWAEVNPALKNTFVGLNMLVADAMFINFDVLKAIADITLPGYNDARPKPNSSAEKKANAAVAEAKKQIDALILKAREVRARKKAWEDAWVKMTEKNRDKAPDKKDVDDAGNALYNMYIDDTKPWDSYIFCDSVVKFSLDKKGNLVFTGVPQYNFLYKITEPATGKVRYLDAVNSDMDINLEMSKIVRGLNPALYDTLTQVAQWTAFFRLAKSKFGGEWTNFMGQLKDVKLDPSYVYPTPRVFDNNNATIKDAYKALGRLN